MKTHKPDPSTCGNCAFGRLVNVGVIDCRGLPPQIVCLGIVQGPLGQQGARMEKFYPQMETTTPACALWKAGGGPLLLGEVVTSGPSTSIRKS